MQPRYGRERETARIDEFLASLGAGDGSVLLVHGEAGMGKSTVWSSGVMSAESRGYRLLRAEPAEAEATLSYAGLADLLRDVGAASFESLPGPQRQALDVALLRVVPTSPIEPRAVFSGLAAVFRRLGEDGPVLVAIDDLHWVDAPTRLALEFAMRRLAGHRVALLATSRAGGEDSFTGAERLALEPLNTAALFHVIREELGVTFPRPVLLRLHAACAGNPFFALEIARVLIETGAPGPGEPLPIPYDLGELVNKRIESLPPVTRRALLTASAAASPVITRVDHAAIAPAIEADLVNVRGGDLRFTHPLYASAVYALAPHELTRRTHALLAAQVDEVEERARHLALATEGTDEGLVATLQEAARSARARGGVQAAAELCELAARRTAVPGKRESLLVTAADDHAAVGDGSRAQDLLEHVLGVTEIARIRAEALHLLGQIRYRQDSFAEANELFTRALEAAAGDQARQAAVELDLAFTLVSQGRMDEGRTHAEAAVTASAAGHDKGLFAQALAVRSVVDFHSGLGIDEAAITRALELEDPGRRAPVPMWPSYIHGLLLCWTDQLAESWRAYEQLREALISQGRERELPIAQYWFVAARCLAGDLGAAQTHAEEAVQIALQLGTHMEQVLALSARALVGAYGGLAERTRDDAGQALALAERTGWQLAASWPLSALGLLELSLDDASATHAALGPMVALVEAAGLADPGMTPFLADEIEALIALGQLDRAEALVETFADRARSLGRSRANAAAARCRALLLAERGDLIAALSAVGQAIDFHTQGEQMPLELARTLMVKGRIERRLKRKAPARASLERAARISREVGAMLWARRAEAELARIGVRGETGTLTAGEKHVAMLAASGMTNREIAAAAFMSQKTVEAHLSRTYRKLGIHSRAQLALRLADSS